MKTYLCIGAGPGIGLATARRFAREGYRIVLASRTPMDNTYLAEQLNSATALAHLIPCTLLSESP
jgi:NAD(P)-dependent dehydrogenase (short-subunit alcohol dehydrogenase family)